MCNFLQKGNAFVFGQWNSLWDLPIHLVNKHSLIMNGHLCGQTSCTMPSFSQNHLSRFLLSCWICPEWAKGGKITFFVWTLQTYAIGAPFTSANSNHCLKKTLNDNRITRHIRVHLGKTITPQIPIHILRYRIVSLSGQQHFDIENTKLIFKSHGM